MRGPRGSSSTGPALKGKPLTRCVICKRGAVKQGKTDVELKVGNDHLLVSVQAEICAECGEAYYSTDVMRHLERVRGDFIREAIVPPSKQQRVPNFLKLIEDRVARY